MSGRRTRTGLLCRLADEKERAPSWLPDVEIAALRGICSADVRFGQKRPSSMSAPMSGFPESGRPADIRIRVTGFMEYLLRITPP
jgi:hypothetical protein